MGFVGAFGETSTPSILSTPENNTDFKIEYASLTLKQVANLNLEMGLLQPNSGFENTYTFNNKNVILGAVASQQPYNAYGARVNYDANEISLWGGYYKNRLDDEEYNSPDYAWEIGVSGSIGENDFSIYNYHIGGQRNLLGAVIEHSIGNIDLAFNIAQELDVGSVQINGKSSRGPDHFPFLGTKSSGLGTQGIKYSIEAMSRPKVVVMNLTEKGKLVRECKFEGN